MDDESRILPVHYINILAFISATYTSAMCSVCSYRSGDDAPLSVEAFWQQNHQKNKTHLCINQCLALNA